MQVRRLMSMFPSLTGIQWRDLDLRPILIGVERELVLAAITGDLSSMRKLLVQRPISEGEAHEGHAASQVIRLT